MDATDWFYSLSASFKALQTLWLLQAGSVPFVLWLLVLAGFAFTQLHRRPRAMRWFLAALGLTIVWHGGAAAIVQPLITGLLLSGSQEGSLTDTAVVLFAWEICPFAVDAAAAACLLKAAFSEPMSSNTPPASVSMERAA